MAITKEQMEMIEKADKCECSMSVSLSVNFILCRNKSDWRVFLTGTATPIGNVEKIEIWYSYIVLQLQDGTEMKVPVKDKKKNEEKKEE
ncbi:MAG: hypothetical protein PHI40_07265 [Caldisericia bacterium]|nr:hypothetical protein [Caldisericia bacterium]